MEKLSEFYYKWPGDCYCFPPPLDVSSIDSGYSRNKTLCSALSNERATVSCARSPSSKGFVC